MDNNDFVGLEKVDELSKLIDLEIGDVDPSIYFERGLEYKNLGDHEKAIDDYTNAINKNPEHYGAYAERGFSYGILGDHSKAIDDFTQAIKVEPSPSAFYNRGIAFRILGEYQLAVNDFTKAIDIGHDSPRPFHIMPGGFLIHIWEKYRTQSMILIRR